MSIFSHILVNRILSWCASISSISISPHCNMEGEEEGRRLTTTPTISVTLVTGMDYPAFRIVIWICETMLWPSDNGCGKCMAHKKYLLDHWSPWKWLPALIHPLVSLWYSHFLPCEELKIVSKTIWRWIIYIYIIVLFMLLHTFCPMAFPVISITYLGISADTILISSIKCVVSVTYCL